MTRYARIADGRVVEIIDLDGIEPSAVFHPDIAATIVPAGQQVAADWSFADGAFSPPPPPSPPSVADLLASAKDRRWQRETGGVLVDGVMIATDDRSKLLITGSRLAANANPSWTTMWEGVREIDAATMIAISDAVEGHVNGVWSTYARVKAAIDAGEITTFAAIDAAFAG